MIYPVLLYLGLQFIMTMVGMVMYMMPRINELLTLDSPDKMNRFITEFQKELLAGPFLLEITGLTALVGIPLFILFRFLDVKAEPYLTEKPGLHRFGVRPHWWLIVMVTSFLVAGGIENLIFLTGLQKIFTGYDEVAKVLFNTAPLWEQLLIVGLFGPILEELLMRGLVYKRLRSITGIGWSAVISSAIFGVIHGNVVQGVFAFSFGMYMAHLYEEQGTILAPILSHIFNNVLATVVTYLGWDLNFGIATDQTFLLILVTILKLGLAAGLVILMDSMVRRVKLKEKNKSRNQNE